MSATIHCGLFCRGTSAGFSADNPSEWFDLGLEAFSRLAPDILPEGTLLPFKALLIVKVSAFDRITIPSHPFRRYHPLAEHRFQSFDEVAEWMDENAMTLYTRGLDTVRKFENPLEVSTK